MILQAIPREVSLMLRIEHCQEVIAMFRGYCKEKPEHTEYYESVVTHLEALIEGYSKQLEQVEAMVEASCQQQH